MHVGAQNGQMTPAPIKYIRAHWVHTPIKYQRDHLKKAHLGPGGPEDLHRTPFPMKNIRGYF